MRLLFVIDNLQSGGAQRQMVNLAAGLHSRAHNVEFFIYYPQFNHFSNRLSEIGIPLHTYYKTHRFSINVILALRRRIRKGGYDAILSFLRTPNIYSEIATLGRRRPVLVVSERGPLSSATPSYIKHLMRHLHRLADHITVNSHDQKEGMELDHPHLRGRITTIYNGVDIDAFCPPATHDNMGDTRRLRILAIGTIHPHKNPTALIQAMALYRRRFHDLPFLVRWVGKVSYSENRDGAFRDAKSLLAQLDIEDHWEWLGERSDVPILLRQHDALIHPSTREGLSNAICEAMACGRPVLASRIADHPRLIEHGVRGYLFDPTDPGTIADALRMFFDMGPAARGEMGNHAREFAERELSLDRFADAYERLFVELLSRRANTTIGPCGS